jgi:predicted nucleotidyltransferase
MSTITAQPQFDFNYIDQRTKQITPALIAALADRIVQHFQPVKIILFGSQANNKSTKESDIDLLVVVDNTHRFALLKPRDRLGKLLELFRYRNFGLDAIVLTNVEVQTLQEVNEGEWDLILEILAEGEVLYDSTQKVKIE